MDALIIDCSKLDARIIYFSTLDARMDMAWKLFRNIGVADARRMQKNDCSGYYVACDIFIDSGYVAICRI